MVTWFGKSKEVWFELLRPEALRASKVPLSSDALTGFGGMCPNVEEKNLHTRDVTRESRRLLQRAPQQVVDAMLKEPLNAAEDDREGRECREGRGLVAQAKAVIDPMVRTSYYNLFRMNLAVCTCCLIVVIDPMVRTQV